MALVAGCQRSNEEILFVQSWKARPNLAVEESKDFRVDCRSLRISNLLLDGKRSLSTLVPDSEWRMAYHFMHVLKDAAGIV